MAPDGFRDGRGRMSTLPPVAFADRSFKNHRPFDRRKPHGPAPQVLTHARCRSTTAPGGASGRRKMRTSPLSQANGRTGRRNGTSSQQDGVPISSASPPVHGRRFALFLAAGLALGFIKISACCNPSLQNSRKAAQIWTALSGKGLLNHVLCSGQCCILQYSRNSLFWAVSNQYAFHLASHASPDRW
jgi:hypothetical protein